MNAPTAARKLRQTVTKADLLNSSFLASSGGQGERERFHDCLYYANGGCGAGEFPRPTNPVDLSGSSSRVGKGVLAPCSL